MAYFRSNVSGGIPAGVRTLPTVATASGSIATFDTDMTENLVEVKCQIVAKQASGTPSPDNPLPIQTYDSLTLYHNDINLWDEQWEQGLYNNQGVKVPNTDAIRATNLISVKPNLNYRIVGLSSGNRVCYYDINGTFLSTKTLVTTDTVPSNAYFMTFSTGITYGGSYNHDISINYPATDTQYHAFNGAYIPFGQNVANGVLDVTTGKLRVTHGVVDLGDLSWTRYNASGNYVFYADILDGKQYATAGIDINSLCSCFSVYPTTLGATAVGSGNDKMLGFNHSTQYTYTRILVKDGDYTSASAFTTAMSGQYLTYELATPIEIQLDSITLPALLNENNVWCDTGNAEVKYLLTVGKAIS